MPAGDAGHESNHGPLCLARAEQDRLRAEIKRLSAQLAAQQAVVAAARKIVRDWDPARMRLVNHRSIDEVKAALDALDKAQVAQPEGERAR